MIGFDPIGLSAIGELSSDGADVLINATSFAIGVTKASPAVHGGASVGTTSRSIAVTVAACLIAISATIAVPTANVAVSSLAPQVQADAARLNPPTSSVAVAIHAPLVSAGANVQTVAASIVVATPAPKVMAGASVSPATASVAVVSPASSVVAGNAVDARNTIIMVTTYGEIASSSIGELSIGEGEPSTRTVLQSPFITVMSAPPFITAGKTILPTAANVSVTSPRSEIDSRDRKLRIYAIAS